MEVFCDWSDCISVYSDEYPTYCCTFHFEKASMPLWGKVLEKRGYIVKMVFLKVKKKAKWCRILKRKVYIAISLCNYKRTQY